MSRSSWRPPKAEEAAAASLGSSVALGVGRHLHAGGR
jgi:hypothetical protein